MDVTVEEAVLQRGFHPGAHASLECAGEVPAGGTEARQVVDLVAVDAFHGEHPGCGERPVDGGHSDLVVRAVGAQVGLEPFHGAGFDDEVELLGEGGGEVLDDSDGVCHAPLRGGALEESRDAFEDGEIGLQARGDAGSLDLDDDFGAVEQLSGVDLRDGG